MTSPARGSYSRRGRRGPLQVIGGVLAVLAVFGSVALFFTDDARLLRLGLVSLLWVAFGSLVAVVHFRKDTERAVSRSADQRAVYELELEREVRARREHELATEREVRAQVSAEVRQEGRLELDELREELKALRENLSLLLSGDLLVERVALRAESTRLRSLTDTARVEAGSTAQLGGTPHGPDPLEAETVEHAPDPRPAVPAPAAHGDPPEASGEPQSAELEIVEPRSEPVAPDAPTEVLAAVRPAEPEPEPDATGPAAAGAHSAGRSVSELLAAYGAGSTGPRRRRRSED
jgi:hypothetical protein